ncbi:MAG: GDP-mannose 4,6-dehydratase, partial [Chloroflexota bacterium]
STSEVYGDPLVHPQPETYWGNVNPVGPRSCYDEGKRFAEALVVNFGQQKRMDYRIVRIFNTYGPRNHPEDGRVIPNFLTQALAGRPITVYGDGSQTRSFCFVSDLVDGLIRTMFTDAASHQVINLGNPTEFTVLDLALQVKSITGTRSPIEHLPARPEEIAQRKPDIHKALSLLNWVPNIELETGLTETLAWLKATLPAAAPQPSR